MDNKAQTFAKWLIMLLFAVPATLRAQTFGGGSGTEIDPYIISNPQHLRQLATEVNNGNHYKGVHFKQNQSFSCWIEPFTPIGGKYYTVTENGTQTTGVRQFCGFYNGNGHTISDLNISCSDSDFYAVGLFGELGWGAYVYNLTIDNERAGYAIKGWGTCGAIAGYVHADAIIQGCHVRKGVVVQVNSEEATTGSSNFGGIAGINHGKIWDCTSRATVTYSDCNIAKGFGGIAGRNDGNISNCFVLGSVIGTTNVGGIAGDEGSNATYNNNYFHTIGATSAVNGSNVEGATWMGTISFGEYVDTDILSSPFYTDNRINYYAAGTKCVLSNDINTSGYLISDFQLTSEQVTINDDTWGEEQAKSFIFPQGKDVVITCTYTSLKRDITYSPWVKIDIPAQEYTGYSLTPVITVTDVKTGTPITLIEDVDYTVTLPDGGCVTPGIHTITITGIGDFGGQATAGFTINRGSGTEEDPFIIVTTEQMDELAASVNGGDNKSGVFFRLNANLDYSGKTYTPIGILEPNCRFDGIFDGYGHSINNVVIDQPDKNYQALFGTIDDNGIVMNLVLGAGSSIKGKDSVGGIAGLCGGTITGCTVSEGVSISGNKEVGGIAGRMSGTLSGCVNNASVSGYNLVGGIAGNCYESIINNNLNLGEIIRTAPLFIAFTGGGIAGIIDNSTLQNNYYAGACKTSGISHKDAKGQAMKGWTISNDENVFAQMFPIDDVEGTFVGITYDGIRYLGAGETTKLLIDRMDGAPAGDFAVTAGTLTPLDEDFYGRTDMFYMLTMPNTGQNVNIYINTATGIDDIPQTSENADGQWYTIDGRRLQGKPTKKGIYIYNGKKVIK